MRVERRAKVEISTARTTDKLLIVKLSAHAALPRGENQLTTQKLF